MPERVHFRSSCEVEGVEFIVGQCRSKIIYGSLLETPHLLVAGQTKSGKSTFLRQLLTTLIVNNPNGEFVLIDGKGGLEFQFFDGLSGCNVVGSAHDVLRELETVDRALDEAMALLKINGCKDIEAFFALDKSVIRPTEDGVSNLKRHFIVIDEAAEVLVAGSRKTVKEVSRIREVVSRIARMGRALGVHLIVATQRPDVKALDPQVKANLTGVLCFQMRNDASSMTVLGSGRATELPPIPGRAIWQVGPVTLELQTPFLSEDEATEFLTPVELRRHSNALL